MKTRAVFRSGLGGKLDQKLVAAMGGLTYARLGDLAKELANDDLTAKTGKYWTAKRKETQAKTYSQRGDGSLHDVLQDARKKASMRVSESIEAHAKKKTSTNNFHQARMGSLLGVLEIISLANRLKDFKGDAKAWAELSASVLTLGSIAADLRYNALKTIRELPEFGKKEGPNGTKLPDEKAFKTQGAKYINKAADIQRGKWKLLSGGMAGVAGGIGAYFDFASAYGEYNKKNSDSFLFSLYVAKGAAGVASAGYSLAIGFSYTAPWLARAGLKGTTRHALASALAKRVGMLLWFARLNAIGIAFTVVEVLYLWLKDNALQNWLDQCTFRREKIAESALTKYSFSVMRATYQTDSFATLDEELEDLTQAFAEITGTEKEPASKPEIEFNPEDWRSFDTN